MEVICIQTPALYELIQEVVEQLKEKYSVREDKWISAEEAMNLLRISSTTTLQKLRDQGRVRFSQPMRKVILYDRESIFELLNNHAKSKF